MQFHNNMKLCMYTFYFDTYLSGPVNWPQRIHILLLWRIMGEEHICPQGQRPPLRKVANAPVQWLTLEHPSLGLAESATLWRSARMHRFSTYRFENMFSLSFDKRYSSVDFEDHMGKTYKGKELIKGKESTFWLLLNPRVSEETLLQRFSPVLSHPIGLTKWILWKNITEVLVLVQKPPLFSSREKSSGSNVSGILEIKANLDYNQIFTKQLSVYGIQL